MVMQTIPESRADLLPVTVRPRRQRQQAFLGVKLGLRGQSSFAVHLFTAAIIFAGGVTLGFTVLEWAIFIVAMGIIFAAELFHAALLHLLHLQQTHQKTDIDQIAALSAGGVLICRLTVVVVAFLIFGGRIWVNLWPIFNG